MNQPNCQEARGQKEIIEIDCPNCGEPGGIELFIRDGIAAESGICDACGYEIPEGTMIE